MLPCNCWNELPSLLNADMGLCGGRYASCAVPQESSDEGIDGLLQEQVMRHALVPLVPEQLCQCHACRASQSRLHPGISNVLVNGVLLVL